MNCPACGAKSTSVTNTRNTGGAVTRRRECEVCGCAWRTVETVLSILNGQGEAATNGRGRLLIAGAATNGPPVKDIDISRSDLDISRYIHEATNSRETATNSRTATYGLPVADGVYRTTARCLEVFRGAWQQVYGAAYVPLPGDNKHLAAYVRAVGDEGLRDWAERCSKYVRYDGGGDRMWRARTNNHSLRWLVTLGRNETFGPARGPSKYQDLVPRPRKTFAGGQG